YCSPQRFIHARAHSEGARQVVVAAEEIAIRGQGARDRRGNRVRGIGDVHVLLVKAVDAQRLLVGAAAEPVVENARAAAERRASALEWCPRDAKARSEIV